MKESQEAFEMQAVNRVDCSLELIGQNSCTLVTMGILMQNGTNGLQRSSPHRFKNTSIVMLTDYRALASTYVAINLETNEYLKGIFAV